VRPRKIPSNAFEHYVSLGDGRSYQAIADQFHVSKRSVVKRALAEGWRERLTRITTTARVETDKKLASAISQMNERHARVLQAVLTKALDALRSMPLGSGADAVRAIDMVLRHERMLYAEPADKTVLSVEEVIRREYREWMQPAGREATNGTDN
jgi:DNA-binding transcriptional regulator LsrR (DeoR family)